MPKLLLRKMGPPELLNLCLTIPPTLLIRFVRVSADIRLRRAAVKMHPLNLTMITMWGLVLLFPGSGVVKAWMGPLWSVTLLLQVLFRQVTVCEHLQSYLPFTSLVNPPSRKIWLAWIA